MPAAKLPPQLAPRQHGSGSGSRLPSWQNEKVEQLAANNLTIPQDAIASLLQRLVRPALVLNSRDRAFVATQTLGCGEHFVESDDHEQVADILNLLPSPRAEYCSPEGRYRKSASTLDSPFTAGISAMTSRG
jgi:hypothetical protein